MSGAPDPFSLTADPEAYVPRAATEAALEALAEGVAERDEVVVLSGPAGIGKTLLLRVLAERLRPLYRPVYVPFPKLPPNELWHWILGNWGERVGPDPQAALQATLKHYADAGRGTLLLLDDGTSLPPETAAALRALATLTGPTVLRIVVALGDEAGSHAVREALGAVEEVRLDVPLEQGEARRYVAARLSRAGGAQRIAPEAVGDLHAASGGNPRELHELADALLRGESLPELVREQEAPTEREESLASMMAFVAPSAPAETQTAAEEARPAAPLRWLALGALLGVALMVMLGVGVWVGLRLAPEGSGQRVAVSPAAVVAATAPGPRLELSPSAPEPAPEAGAFAAEPSLASVP
ncbi:MAG: ATP-binding protein, partial [Proteobacteria bacterium]|nr:ATP-binding protein [Pseudomonadota bacterium]